MKYKQAVNVSILFILFLFHHSVAALENEQLDAFTNFISKSAKTIGGDKQIGVKLSMDWKENPEIKIISTYSDIKRVATIETIVGYLNKNEKKIFPNINSSDHAIMLIATRLVSLKYINSLVSTSDNDVVIKDYIDSEIADLTMMLNGTTDYNAVYINASKARDEKIAMLLYINKEFLTNKLTLMMDETNIAQVLANKTYLISLVQTCSSIPQSCAKL